MTVFYNVMGVQIFVCRMRVTISKPISVVSC